MSSTRTNRRIAHREIIAVYCDNHRERAYIVSENADFLEVRDSGFKLLRGTNSYPGNV